MRGTWIVAACLLAGGCSIMYEPDELGDEVAVGDDETFEPIELEQEPPRCPVDFVPPAVLFTQQGFGAHPPSNGDPPLYEGYGAFMGADDHDHLVAIYVDQTVDTGRELLALDEVFVVLAARWGENQEPAITYLATGGSVRFTELCPTGMRGVMTGLHLIELDPTTEEPLDIGCEADLPTTNFSFGSGCL